MRTQIHTTNLKTDTETHRIYPSIADKDGNTKEMSHLPQPLIFVTY
jgi:hypothetical protein